MMDGWMDGRDGGYVSIRGTEERTQKQTKHKTIEPKNEQETEKEEEEKQRKGNPFALWLSSSRHHREGEGGVMDGDELGNE